MAPDRREKQRVIVMAPSPEPSYVLKLKRARVHLDELNLACRNWVDRNGTPTCRMEPAPDAPGYVLLKATVDPIGQEPFSLLIGDTVQNLRNSLDHLVFSLAIAHSHNLSEEETRNSQFPIIGGESANGTPGAGPEKFRHNAIPSMIKKVSPQAKTIIEGLQPFKLGAAFRTHPLWRLNELANCDKHRFVHVAIGINEGMAMRPWLNRNCIIGPGTIEVLGTLMGGETVIAKIPARPADPNAEMHMDISPSLCVAFSEGISKKSDVVKELAEIYNYIVGSVFPKFSGLI
jgi:hypothetical protein